MPPSETIAEIIDERVVAFFLPGDGRDTHGDWRLARIITDNAGTKFHAQTLSRWRAGARPGDERLEVFAKGTAGPPYRGNPNLPDMTSATVLDRLRRARGSFGVITPGPELTQAWTDNPADVRRALNAAMDANAKALEERYKAGWEDGRAAGYAEATRDLAASGRPRPVTADPAAPDSDRITTEDPPGPSGVAGA